MVHFSPPDPALVDDVIKKEREREMIWAMPESVEVGLLKEVGLFKVQVSLLTAKAGFWPNCVE